MVLLGGDLNAQPDAPAVRWLERQEAAIAYAAWREPHDARPAATYPSIAPEVCLDHLYHFGSTRFAVYWSKVQRVLDMPDSQGGFASDHAAVLGSLAIQGDGRC
jgi:endonuclease/exonuclease/phosphatase family metal-dependent hydrolase